MRWLELRIPPPVVAVLVAGGMGWLAGSGPAWDLPAAWRGVIAGLLVVASLGIDLAGLLAFRRARTTINPLSPQRTSALVTQGVYRVSRNPMYLGMAGLLLAWAAWLAALWPLLGPVVFVAYITRFQIVPEERVLRAHFGDAFTTYAARVRRWL